MRSELIKRGSRVFGSEDAGCWTVVISEEPTVQQIHEDGLNFNFGGNNLINVLPAPTKISPLVYEL